MKQGVLVSPKRDIAGVSFVIPALNEQGAIKDTVTRCLAVIDGLVLPGEVIVVDDGSTDQTANLAVEAGAKVIQHVQNAGYGRSLKDGVKAASHDTIVMMDADGTYPVEAVPEMLAAFGRGFNLVVGHRQGEHYKQSWWKMPLRRILQFLTEFTSGKQIQDVNSGMRVFSRAEILPYFNQLCETFSFTTSLTLSYLMTGKFLAYVPIVYGKRCGRTKVRHFQDSLRTLQFILQAIIYYNPIKGFCVICSVMLVFALMCFLLSVISRFAVGYYLGIGILLASIVTFSFSFVCELLRQDMRDKGDAQDKDL